MVTIRIINKAIDSDAAVKVLREANATIAKELKLTPENAPTHPAFISTERFKEQFTHGKEFYVAELKGQIVGLVGIEKAPAEHATFYIERLAVLPEFRHQGIGKYLMDCATDRAIENRGKMVSVAIINENTRLKKWYCQLGFVEKETKHFEHLPFTVCFMKKELG